MNCTFDIGNTELHGGPTHNILHPVGEEELSQGPVSSIEGLPSLDEFCQNSKDSVNTIYNILQNSDNNELYDILKNLSQVQDSTSNVSPLNNLESGFYKAENFDSQYFSDLPSHSQSLSDTLVSNNDYSNHTSQSNDHTVEIDSSLSHFASPITTEKSRKTEPVGSCSSPLNSTHHLNQEAADYANHEVITTCSMDTSTLISEIPNSVNIVTLTANNIHTSLASRPAQEDPCVNSGIDLTNKTFTSQVSCVSQDTAPSESSVHSCCEPNDLEHRPDQGLGFDEDTIDLAMASVFNDIGQRSQKDIQSKLDEYLVERCLEHSVNSPILICNSCYQVFQSITPFQVHVRTCCDPPRMELKQKMDQTAMETLAKGLWKQVFLDALRSVPHGPAIMKEEDVLHYELDQLWLSPESSMIRCRDIFIKAAVAIVSRKWICTAYANELHRLRSRTPKAPPRKRGKSETEIAEVSTVAPSPQESSGSSQITTRKNKRGRPKAIRKTEDEIAVQALISENKTDVNANLQRFNFTPETPISEHGLDNDPSSPVLGKRRSKSIPILDSSIEMTVEFDTVIDGFVREVDAEVNDDVAAAAAKNLENFDDRGNWETGQPSEEIADNEYVVGEILHRRLCHEVIGRLPVEEDYEYLVSWEGYGDEENTWEPYEHLKHCTLKLKEFHDRLKTKALRKRKGKRI